MADKPLLNLSPEREPELLAAIVGTAEELNGPVLLVPYKPHWPVDYGTIEARLRTELGPAALLVEHVGSTSVPELTAKPIIDILLAVADSAREANYMPALHRLGFELRLREPGWYEHRMLRLSVPRVNLHVFSAGCAELTRMIRFRDHLRDHPQDRLLYERTKVELASRSWKYMQAYADAKTAVISSILDRAFASDPSASHRRR
jgi:GrpB-like predicted nucleotidyltransferase (UPF0157 family)